MTVILCIIIFLLCTLFGIVAQDLNEDNVALTISKGYTYGMAMILAIIRIVSYIIGNFFLSLCISAVIFMVLFLIYQKKRDNRRVILSKKFWRYICFCIFIATFIFINNMVLLDTATPDNYDVWSHIGSAHSGRYVNLAYDIFKQNRIPILGQNYGGSLLLAVFLESRLEKGYFALAILVALSNAILWLFTYGLFIKRGIGKWIAAIYSFAVMIGNTALSTCCIVVFDTAFRFMFSGYIETSMMILTLYLCFELVMKYVNGITNKIKLNDIVMFVSIGFSWNIIGGYTAVLFLFIVVGIMFLFFKRKATGNLLRTMLCIGVIYISFILGIFSGGVFTPSSKYDEIQFEGMLEAQGDGVAKGILPYYEYMLGGSTGVAFINLDELNAYKQILNSTSSEDVNYNTDVLWYAIETGFFDMLRVMFWPILGVLLLLSKNYKTGGLVVAEMNDDNEASIILLGLITVFVGVGAAYGVIYGAKWWLTRLAIYGVYFGFLSLFFYLAEVKMKYKKIIISLILFTITAGTIRHIICRYAFWLNTYSGFKGWLEAFVYKCNMDASIFY